MALTLPNPHAHQLRADLPASSTCPFLRSHPAVLHHLRTSGERLLLLGHRSKWETVVIPDEVADVVVVLESLPYTVCVWCLGCGCCDCLHVGALIDGGGLSNAHAACESCTRLWVPLPLQLYFDTLSRCRAIMLAFATGGCACRAVTWRCQARPGMQHECTACKHRGAHFATKVCSSTLKHA